MHVYTLQAHRSFDVLANQVQALRTFLTPDKITVVQGPYGRQGDSDRRLTLRSAAALAVEILELPRMPPGGTYAKQPAIYAHLVNKAIPQGQEAIILHGDCFPTRPMSLAKLLERCSAAGRGHEDSGRPHLHYTWLALAGDRPPFVPPYWDADFRLWPATREGEYEHCAPGWWHADRVNLWHKMEAAHKLAEIGRRFPCEVQAETELAPLTMSPAMFYDRTAMIETPEADFRREVCRDCKELPEGCWHRWQHLWTLPWETCDRFHAAERHAVHFGYCPLNKWQRPKIAPLVTNRALCPSCDLELPKITSLADVHSEVRDILKRELSPPEFSAPAGIVTTGEGRYAAGIKIGVRILREKVGCALPMKIFHKGPFGEDMRGLDVELIDSTQLQATHPARQYGGWESKSYAVLHSGFERVMFLDGDAMLVRDPAPLFALLDDYGFVVWADYGPGWACGHALDNMVLRQNHQNGGEFLVNLKTWWTPFVAKRFLDNWSDIYYKEGRLGDECSTRLVRALIQDKGVLEADWVDRTRGVGIRCRYPAYGPVYVAHAMRRESKLIVGNVPRRARHWEYESEVMAMFAEMDPAHQERKRLARLVASPENRRAERERLFRGKGKAQCGRR